MTRETVTMAGTETAVFRLPGEAPSGAPELIWAHGWGHTHAALLPLAETMRRVANSRLIDFPGFGASPLPPAAWGTEDYAAAAAEWLASLPPARRVWVGHSFGCRVGLRLAARHPDSVAGLFLIAAAGLRQQRSLPARLRLSVRRSVFRVMRQMTPEGQARDQLRERFGSADYRQAGTMRPIFVKTVSEDLTSTAQQVRCPTVLLNGDGDTETPPDMGLRYSKLIPSARFVLLRGFDHWTVLTDGRHQVAQRLTEFLEQIA